MFVIPSRHVSHLTNQPMRAPAGRAGAGQTLLRGCNAAPSRSRACVHQRAPVYRQQRRSRRARATAEDGVPSTDRPDAELHSYDEWSAWCAPPPPACWCFFAAVHRGKLMQNLGRAPARRGALSGMAPGAWPTARAAVLQVGQRAHIRAGGLGGRVQSAITTGGGAEGEPVAAHAALALARDAGEAGLPILLLEARAARCAAAPGEGSA